MRILLTTSILALTLAACGGSEDSQTPAKAEVTAPAVTPAETETPSEPVATETVATPQAEPEVLDPVIQAKLDALPAPYNEADFSNGQRIFKQCSTCHLTEEGAGNRVGPNLYGVFGRHTAQADGFSYSDALKEADFEWTPEQLDAWLTNPRKFLPGNRMSFAGVRKPDDRRDVIAYLLVATSPDE